LKYEIRRDVKYTDGQTTVTLNNPEWIIYYEGKEKTPSLRSFSSVYGALKHFVDGIGSSEGILRIIIETCKE
jgi:hypothetical protein